MFSSCRISCISFNNLYVLTFLLLEFTAKTFIVIRPYSTKCKIKAKENMHKKPPIMYPNTFDYPLGVIFPFLSNFLIIGCNFQKYVLIERIIATTPYSFVSSVPVNNITSNKKRRKKTKPLNICTLYLLPEKKFMCQNFWWLCVPFFLLCYPSELQELFLVLLPAVIPFLWWICLP